MSEIGHESIGLEWAASHTSGKPKPKTRNRTKLICAVLTSLCRRQHPDTDRSGALLPNQVSDQAGKLTLVLDLDETLIHATEERPVLYQHIVYMKEEERIELIYVQTRPGLEEFIETTRSMYELVLFTAGDRSYAEPIINSVPCLRKIQLRLYRQHCSQHSGHIVKDLSLLARDLRKVVILDNTPENYSRNSKNALPVSTWTGESDDIVLHLLLPLLKRMSNVKDVPGFLEKEKDDWRTRA